MMLFRKAAPGLDPAVVHPRTKSEDMLFGIMREREVNRSLNGRLYAARKGFDRLHDRGC